MTKESDLGGEETSDLDLRVGSRVARLEALPLRQLVEARMMAGAQVYDAIGQRFGHVSSGPKFTGYMRDTARQLTLPERDGEQRTVRAIERVWTNTHDFRRHKIVIYEGLGPAMEDGSPLPEDPWVVMIDTDQKTVTTDNPSIAQMRTLVDEILFLQDIAEQVLPEYHIQPRDESYLD